MMNKELNKAIQAEEAEYYETAIAIYKDMLGQEDTPLDAFINLAFLYFIFAAEPFFAERNKLSTKTKAEIKDNGYTSVINKGLAKYPDSIELHFWASYFPNRTYFKPFSKEDCLKIIETYRDGPSLVPYFYLKTFKEGTYQIENEALFEQCKQVKTAKNNYILSFIDM